MRCIHTTNEIRSDSSKHLSGLASFSALQKSVRYIRGGTLNFDLPVVDRAADDRIDVRAVDDRSIILIDINFRSAPQRADE
jgi:hypothetical protein